MPTEFDKPGWSRLRHLPVEPAPASDIQQDASPAIHAEPMATPVITAAMPPGEEVILLSEKATQDLGKATGLILPRETTEIPGYSKWTEGAMFGPETTPVEKAARWPFVLASLLLILALCGQLIFRFRSEIAMTSPGLRPMLEEFSKVFNASLPLPRHVELVSIETSDLQTDPAHGNLLVLNATLRNRASYEQDYPALELSLTDTQDAAIARRVFMPGEYLLQIACRSAFRGQHRCCGTSVDRGQGHQCRRLSALRLLSLIRCADHR